MTQSPTQFTYPVTNPVTNPFVSVTQSPTHVDTYPVTDPVTENVTYPVTKPLVTRVTPRSFVLKVKTPQIRVCQSCRQSYEDENDTLNLVVARLERRVISNLSTGVQFIGRESNSHYHLHMHCLKAADPTFTGSTLQIPNDVKVQLTNIQKLYLISCIQVPDTTFN